MVAKLNAVFNKIKADGRIDKKELTELLKAAADGKGITETEAKKLHQIREQHADLFTRGAREGFDRFLTHMDRSWSRTKDVHLPNLDENKIKELLLADPRIGIATGRSGGGKGGSTVTRPRPGGGSERPRGGGTERPTVRPSPSK